MRDTDLYLTNGNEHEIFLRVSEVFSLLNKWALETDRKKEGLKIDTE